MTALAPKQVSDRNNEPAPSFAKFGTRPMCADPSSTETTVATAVDVRAELRIVSVSDRGPRRFPSSYAACGLAVSRAVRARGAEPEVASRLARGERSVALKLAAPHVR